MKEINERKLIELIVKHLAGELNEEEKQILLNWATDDPLNKQLLNKVSNEEELQIEINKWRQADPSDGYAQWLQASSDRRKLMILRFAIPVAAALLLAVAGIWLIKRMPHTKQRIPILAAEAKPVLPGRNTAILMLSNGRQVLLDSADNGDIEMEGKTRLVKVDSGSLSYKETGKKGGAQMVYNTLSTPRSGQFQLTLPDGSRVWLNNISSLRYPVAFLDKTRTVELTGEAYFEIAKDPAKPFIVKVRNESVKVLGTSFNIMAYLDEEIIQTTLLTGGIKVESGTASITLQPNEQAMLSSTSGLQVVKDVSSQDIISWKNGFFYFGRASFKAVMRQLARWYNVEVVYEGKAPDLEFGGKIDRSLSLNELLKFLDKNQIHFRLEGRKIVVLPS